MLSREYIANHVKKHCGHTGVATIKMVELACEAQEAATQAEERTRLGKAMVGPCKCIPDSTMSRTKKVFECPKCMRQLVEALLRGEELK